MKKRRVVILNEEKIKRLADDLEAAQADVVSGRSVLRFLWARGINGELQEHLEKRIETLLLRDLTGLEPTSASSEWVAAFQQLQEDSDAKLPGD